MVRGRKFWAFLLAFSLSLSPLTPVGYAFAEENDGQQKTEELQADDGLVEGAADDGFIAAGETDGAVDDAVVIPDSEDDFEDSSLVAQADYAAVIDDIGYETLEAAFDAAQSGDTIKLVKDIELERSYTVSRKNQGDVFTLDLNGHTLLNANDGTPGSTLDHNTLRVTFDTSLIVTDSSADKTGKIANTSSDGIGIAS